MSVMGMGEMSGVEGIGRYHEPLCIQIPLSGFSTDQIGAVRKIWQWEQRFCTEEDKNSSESFLDRICSGSNTLFPTLTCAAKSKSMMRAFDRIANHFPEREVRSKVRATSGEGADLAVCRSKNDKSALAQSHSEDISRRQRLVCAHEVP